MSAHLPISMQTVPLEMLTLILGAIDDNTFLYTVCRQVTRVFRNEVDFIFRYHILR